MSLWLELLAAFLLFLLGLRLSAFFSGSETGYYRASFLRLSLEAQAGDRTAKQLMWFAKNPSYFVATTLVGNNVANFLVTLAAGIGATALFQAQSAWIEVASALVLSPIVFVFGELVPKSLYYRAPLQLLRQDAGWFAFFFLAFLAVSFPLIWITKLFETIGGLNQNTFESALGRQTLVQVLLRGHEEGLLTDVQSRLIHGLLYTAAKPVTNSMTPANRVLGVDADSPREQILEFARKYGATSVAVKRQNTVDDWFGYLRVVDLSVSPRPVSTLIRTMPAIPAKASKLEALLILRNHDEDFGIMAEGERVLGVVSERGLVEQLFRSAQTIGSRE
jgi:putative hemolysin